MRIITGSARGTRLKSPAGDGTRPTADRTREALFSMLGRRVVDARVLDLFAGTGALALEALSGGAASAARGMTTRGEAGVPSTLDSGRTCAPNARSRAVSVGSSVAKERPAMSMFVARA